MSWAIGFDSNWDRDVGYGVPAYCDHPKCNEEIDRGLAYVCGGEPYGGEHGCGLYFCANHLFFTFGGKRSKSQLCRRCTDHRQPYKHPKPEHPEWLRHKLTHESWAPWRSKHAKAVAVMTATLGIPAVDPEF